MFDSIVESPIVLALVCGLIAALLVAAGYKAACMTRPAFPAPMPAKPPLRSFWRASVVVFVLLYNAASLGLAHRFPFGIDLMATGFLMLLFMPPDEAGADG